jgi:hypothetical protein
VQRAEGGQDVTGEPEKEYGELVIAVNAKVRGVPD